MNEQYYFFWGERPFSQWCQSIFKIEGVEYNCSEQWMMAEKARFFKDYDAEQAIMEATHPRDQKKLGRKVVGFHADKWNAVARDIVYEGNLAKFTQNPEMKEQLLATFPKILVEASPYDCIWGIGLDSNKAKITPAEQWRGKNWLGEVLTGLRHDLIDGY